MVELTASVPRVRMALGAIRRFAIRLRRQQCVDKYRMTMKARALSDPPVSRLDLNRLVEPAGGECQRMKKTVVRLRDPLAGEIVREVTVVTRGDVPVAGIEPRVVMALHDMAIRAGGWVVAQVGRAVTVPKSEYAQTNRKTQAAGQRGQNGPARKTAALGFTHPSTDDL